jgi:hypothetical protein
MSKPSNNRYSKKRRLAEQTRETHIPLRVMDTFESDTSSDNTAGSSTGDDSSGGSSDGGNDSEDRLVMDAQDDSVDPSFSAVSAFLVFDDGKDADADEDADARTGQFDEETRRLLAQYGLPSSKASSPCILVPQASKQSVSSLSLEELCRGKYVKDALLVCFREACRRLRISLPASKTTSGSEVHPLQFLLRG